ncbi:MAG: hypothetical protein ACE5EH_12545 [Gammaproteobacteria bacterium]
MRSKLIKRCIEFTLITLVFMLAILSDNTAHAEATVIELTQVPCQFLEVESRDHHFKSSRSGDCEKINATTQDARLKRAKTLRLKPGDYVFRVTNKNVSYELGFYLRAANLLNRLSLPSVSGGGLLTGKTRDYPVKLIAGQYAFSCPLNPTPDYRLIVSE